MITRETTLLPPIISNKSGFATTSSDTISTILDPVNQRFTTEVRKPCNRLKRWYEPTTGKWHSNDPIGISGGLNQYVFCGDNPVNFLDPYGLSGRDAAGLIYFPGNKRPCSVQSVGQQNLLIPTTPAGDLPQGFAGIILQLGNALNYMDQGILSPREGILYGLGFFPHGIAETRTWATDPSVQRALDELNAIQPYVGRIQALLDLEACKGHKGNVTIEIDPNTGGVSIYRGPSISSAGSTHLLFIDRQIPSRR